VKRVVQKTWIGVLIVHNTAQPWDRFAVVHFRTRLGLNSVVAADSKSLVAVIKQNAGLDSFDSKKIQEGQGSYSVAGKSISVRINSLPASYGEKITIRILKKSLDIIRLDEIGLALSCC